MRATGYRTDAERQGGGAVFAAPALPVPLDQPARWWRFVKGADWRHPRGSDTSIVGHEREPVVQVTRADATAYARWTGGSLPDETQWERAARGRQQGERSPQSRAFAADGTPVANVWESAFPVRDGGADGHAGLAPAGCYPPNDFGLVDMIGNAWDAVTGDDGADADRHDDHGDPARAVRRRCGERRDRGADARQPRSRARGRGAYRRTARGRPVPPAILRESQPRTADAGASSFGLHIDEGTIEIPPAVSVIGVPTDGSMAELASPETATVLGDIPSFTNTSPEISRAASL